MKKKISFPSFIMQNEQHLSKYTHLFEWMNAIKKEHHYTNNSFTIDNNTLPNNIPMDTGAMCDGFSVPRILFCKYHSYFNRLPFDVSSLNGLLLINSFFLITHWYINAFPHSHTHCALPLYINLLKLKIFHVWAEILWKIERIQQQGFGNSIHMYRKSKMATHTHTSTSAHTMYVL